MEFLWFITHLTSWRKKKSFFFFSFCKCLSPWKQEVIFSRLLRFKFSCQADKKGLPPWRFWGTSGPQSYTTEWECVQGVRFGRAYFVCACYSEGWEGEVGGQERLYDDPAFNTVCWACMTSFIKLTPGSVSALCFKRWKAPPPPQKKRKKRQSEREKTMKLRGGTGGWRSMEDQSGMEAV